MAFVVAGSDAPPVLGAPEHPLDSLSPYGFFLVVRYRLPLLNFHGMCARPFPSSSSTSRESRRRRIPCPTATAQVKSCPDPDFAGSGASSPASAFSLKPSEVARWSFAAFDCLTARPGKDLSNYSVDVENFGKWRDGGVASTSSGIGRGG